MSGRDVGQRRQRRGLGAALAFLALLAAMGCEALGQPHPSILDECAQPTASNIDWCHRMQHPNVR